MSEGSVEGSVEEGGGASGAGFAMLPAYEVEDFGTSASPGAVGLEDGLVEDLARVVIVGRGRGQGAQRHGGTCLSCLQGMVQSMEGLVS